MPGAGKPMNDIPERDWQMLRKLKEVTLDRLCEEVLGEAAKITGDAQLTPHQRYLKLYQCIERRDKDIANAFNDHRRSTALVKIAQIHRRGLFKEEEFAGFSEETRKLVLELEAL
jgi:hypothetical protein